MSTKSTATFQITGWDEKPVSEEGATPKLTKAHVTCTFSGDIAGEGAVDYLMVYPTADTARFVGLQQVNGQLGERKGSFVLEATGKFEGGVVAAQWAVVPGTGTGELVGLTGTGGFESSGPAGGDITFEYDL